MNLFRIYLFLALTGCAIVSNDRVEGWPDLMPIVHYVGEAELRDRCDPNAGLMTASMACATFDLKERECHIWLSRDFPPPANVREHELKHCRGHDHVFGTTMQRILAGAH